VEEDEVGMARSADGGEEERVLVIKPDGKRPLERPKTWVDNIKMDLSEIGLSVLD
jgi:hypothetical protein